VSKTLHILHYKTIALGSYFKEMNGERIVKLLVGILVMSLFFSGGLYLFYKVFNYLAGLMDIGYLLINKIISLGFLAIFVMLIISNLVTSISTLYKSQETSFLLTTPANYRQVFTVKFIDNMVFSTWAVLLMGLPVILAYGLVRGFSVWEYLFEFLCVLMPFVIIPACIGVMASIFMFMISRLVRPRTLILWTMTILFLGVALYFKLGQPTSLALNVVSDWRVLNQYLNSMGATSFPFLPSYWVSETLRIMASDGGNLLFTYMLALISTAFLAVNLVFAVANKYYYRSWLASLENIDSDYRRAAQRRRQSTFFRLPHWLPSDFRAVLAKDLKMFVREPAQWAQFSVLLVLLVIYLVNLKYFPTDLKDSFWKTFIGFTNYAFSGFILATLSVRFVFPNISLEGLSFWVVASSPMSKGRLFWEKFWVAFFIFMLISEVLAFVSNIMLGLRGVLMILTFISVLLMSVSLTSLSVGLGAIYPRFEERNPGKIASTMGGMLATVLSLAYVGLMVIIAALPAHRYSLHKIDPTIPFPIFEVGVAVVMMLILNLTTTIVPLRLGFLAMKRREL
jgi:ABC-2 type transport system permease protein